MTKRFSSKNIFTGTNSLKKLKSFLRKNNYSSVFILADPNTEKYCYRHLKKNLSHHRLISIPCGEENKNLKSCEKIWDFLNEFHADRNSVLINLGGGMISDLGGFAAGVFKRGINFIHIPTSLLSQCDASIGGKSGIDFKNFKNLLGIFQQPNAVFIYPDFLKTLPKRELHSGLAEIIKHHLIADKYGFRKLLTLKTIPVDWKRLIRHSIKIKSAIVKKDPFEKNIRKALNFGHTIGHSIESLFLEVPGKKLLHGEAIAIGIVAESFISFEKKLISIAELNQITDCIDKYFELPQIDESGFDSLIELMMQDKKNEKGKFKFTLLNGIGNFKIDQPVETNQIISSLQYYNFAMHSN